MNSSTFPAAHTDLTAFDPTSSAWRPARREPVAIYGAGSFARAVRDVISDAGASVLYALDQRADSIGSLGETRVHPPGKEPLALGNRADVTAVVSVFNRDADPAEIERRLLDLGYGRVVGVPELYEAFGEALGARFWLAQRSVYAEHYDAIHTVANLWTDSLSRDLYRSLLRYRLGWDANDAPGPAPGFQYFPNDVPRGDVPMCFIDCGAFVGDTLTSVARLGWPVHSAYAFEPDLRNFTRLARYGAEFSAATRAQVALWPCAVAARSGVARFRADGGESGHLASDGEQILTTVALDDVVPSVRVTDLKMDIEGAELEALRGAERTIKRARPRLAICVYHRASHLWEVPLYVRELSADYDFYLRSHGHYGFDVVMYAVPRRTT